MFFVFTENILNTQQVWSQMGRESEKEKYWFIHFSAGSVCLHQTAQAYIDAKAGQSPSEPTPSVNPLQKCFALNVHMTKESHVK